jgi:predicted transcriptional regulator
LADDPLGGTRSRRDRLLIIAEILNIARRGSLKTRIMYTGNLSFAQLKEYLTLLMDFNLLEVAKKSQRTVYKTTDKGLQYLQSYEEIRELLREEKEGHKGS